MSGLSLSPRAFRVLLLAFGLLSPLPFFAGVARNPLRLVPCGPPPLACALGDPAIATSVLGRAWSRFERGEPWNRDDRVFAPYPDSWALSEGYLIEAIVGYPWARLTGAPALGYNVPYACAWVFAFWSAGALFLRIAGPGWSALLGAFLFTWSSGRLNSVGVLGVLWAGLVPLALAFGLDVLRRGRRRDALLFGAAWLAIGMGSLYGLLMGGITATLLLLPCGLRSAEGRRRLLLLLAAALGAAVPLVIVHRPLFTLARDFDVTVARSTFEGQSADLASLLHHAGFSAPLRAAFDALLPGFPPGAPGLFPGTLALAAAGLWLLLPRPGRSTRQPGAPERDLRLWLALAAATFAFALGPTIHLLGRPLAPGPWRIFTHVPVLSSMRGLFRWDQWFFLAVAGCVVLVLSAAEGQFSASTGARAAPGAILAGLGALALLAVDLWPRPIVASALPGPSPFQDVLLTLERDAIVAVYPFERATSERAWVEQLFHRRRVLNGFQSFPTPVHLWLDGVSRTRAPGETLAIYRELGASAIEVDLAAVPLARRPETRSALAALPRIAPILERGDRLLLLLRPLAPVLVDPLALGGLSFQGREARIDGPPGRLVFRLRSGALPVQVESGASSSAGVLRIPLVGAGGLPVRLDETPPPGGRVRGPNGVEIGAAAGTPPTTAAPPPRTSTRSARSPTP